MKIKLSLKLALTFMFITSFLVILIALATNYYFERNFKRYVMDIQEQKNLSFVGDISNYYEYADGNLNEENLEKIGMNALEEGLIIKITNLENYVLWDAMEHNSGMCVEMLAEMAKNIQKYYPDFDGEYTVVGYDLIANNEKVGKVSIGYYGPYYLTENDVEFLKTFNKLIFIIGFIAIIFSVFIGMFISKKLTKNITGVIDGTKQISDGNFKFRIKERTDTIEIEDLINSVNSLADNLEKNQQLRNQITSDIAHEIRTPIATLQSHLEALKDKVWDINEERIQSLYEEIVRISQIVQGLDNLEYFDRGNQKLVKQEFNIKKLIKEIILNFEKEALDKNITIQFNSPETYINADKNKLKQVFINLISNSIKYTNQNGNIKIKLIEKNNKYIFIIKDNGIGIPNEDLPYIFERFYKVDKSRNRAVKGSGIGLSIVKSIINLHNGTINVKSVLGKGTTFIITLLK